MKNKKLGFTLAETLIVMAVIGVVAALTIPNLMHKFRNSVLKTQFKNSTAKFQQALKKAKADSDIETFAIYCTIRNSSNNRLENENQCLDLFYGAYNSVGFQQVRPGAKYSVLRDLSKIYNFNKTANLSDMELDGSMFSYTYTNQMLDGTYIGMHVAWVQGYNYSFHVVIDTNGEKGPNKLGYDIFEFYINKDDDSLVGFKPNGVVYTNREDIDNLVIGNGNFYYKEMWGRPCNLVSPQVLNGIGCGWYALRDICPMTGEKGYFECLP